MGISNSGRSINTVEALHIAQKTGAHTICITNYEDNPITGFADIVLYPFTKDFELFEESLLSRAAELARRECGLFNRN